jgi:hypothetical protein
MSVGVQFQCDRTCVSTPYRSDGLLSIRNQIYTKTLSFDTVYETLSTSYSGIDWYVFGMFWTSCGHIHAYSIACMGSHSRFTDECCIFTKRGKTGVISHSHVNRMRSKSVLHSTLMENYAPIFQTIVTSSSRSRNVM